MGGILAAPKAPSLPVLPAAKPSVADGEEVRARLEQIDRNRRGRAGTVQTSDRGLLTAGANATTKKTLLGE